MKLERLAGDRNENTDALRASFERLERQHQLLVGFLVHDLKNHVGVVRANLSWMKETLGSLSKDVGEALDDSYEAATRLAQMASDMLVVARIEDAELEIASAPVRLAPIVRETLRARERDAAARSVTTTIEADDAATARGDGALLRRVTENLVDNALRYVQRGGAIHARLHVEAGKTRLALSHTGKPVPAESRAALMDDLARVGETSGSVALGLYFCALVVRAHGGTIDVGTNDAWPTTIALCLPAS